MMWKKLTIYGYTKYFGDAKYVNLKAILSNF